MDFNSFASPILLQGNARTAYRDPAVFYWCGTFYFYFTLVETEEDGRVFLYVAMCTSLDLKHFSPIVKLTVRDQSCNYSSPGNVFRFRGRFYLCCQSYCRENGEKYGNSNSRIFLMCSDDLLHWNTPVWLDVKHCLRENAGRMIDPYVIEDLNIPGRWLCFYKQNGVSVSESRDLVNWMPLGSTDCGENVCVLYDRNKELYRLWHSPRNGIGVKVSRDLLHWQDEGEIITLGQRCWSWAQGRLTAGMVLDLRKEPTVGKALLFFHGTGPQDEEVIFDQYACIGFAWSDDLTNWNYIP